MSAVWEKDAGNDVVNGELVAGVGAAPNGWCVAAAHGGQAFLVQAPELAGNVEVAQQGLLGQGRCFAVHADVLQGGVDDLGRGRAV
jgi:hypothetical protein